MYAYISTNFQIEQPTNIFLYISCYAVLLPNIGFSLFYQLFSFIHLLVQVLYFGIDTWYMETSVPMHLIIWVNIAKMIQK